MKKLMTLLILILTTIGCGHIKVEPIEKYKGCVLINNDYTRAYNPEIRLKSKDSIFWITVSQYDSKRFNVGDTIK